MEIIICRIHNNFLPEFNYATKFFSWGYEDSNFKNVVGLFNFKTLKKIHTKSSNKKKKLVIFSDSLSNIADNLFYSSEEITKSLFRIELILKGVKKEIRDNIVLRLNNSFYEEIYGKNYINYFNNFDIEIDNGKRSQTKLLKDAKLCIFNYDSTGFLENICKNFPSTMFFGHEYLNFINSNFTQKYNTLNEAKILFYNDTQLCNHLNLIG